MMTKTRSIHLQRVTVILIWCCCHCICTDESTKSHKDNLTAASSFLDKLLKDYDRRLTPTFNEEIEIPTVVTCDVFVSIISSIEEYTMDYGVTIFLRQSWTDPRLRHHSGRKIPSSSRLMERLWIPDLFFTNEKQGTQHELTVENKLLRIIHTGEVMISQRLSLKLMCHMDLHRFPMDHQDCEMEMESFGYTTNQLMFEWRNDDDVGAVQVNPNLPVTQFTLVTTETKRCDKTYWTGNFSCIAVSFHFTRELGYYLLSTYCPTFALVVLSWISFWMPPDAAPARISLGITVILTTTTQAIGLRESFAKVSYITAIDIWMTTCLIFVMASIVEFSIVNFLHHLSERYRKKSNTLIADEKKSDLHENGGQLPEGRHANVVCIGRAVDSPSEETTEDTVPPDVAMSTKFREMSSNLDKVSQFLFPAAFLVFNVTYWSLYTSSFQLPYVDG
ncbi:glycine receptor subunit alpha-2-like [Ptychodera flava]|uniref:glycine receptor subunit alpha-2-like n=1 Tax=Ptychodera flava TaxID=63121 RepID=UPI00396A7036